MTTQTDIPSDFDKALVFHILDGELNSQILSALLSGIYTGILAVTLWNICEPGVPPLQHRSEIKGVVTNKLWTIRRAIVVLIILLYALIAINFSARWSWTHLAFIENEQHYWTVYSSLVGDTDAVFLMADIVASISTILTDLYMIWCCWMIWGRRWLIVLLPVLSLLATTASKTTYMYYYYVNAFNLANLSVMLYISFILVTTLSCTLLIIYRIVAVSGVRHGEVNRLGVYRRFIEALVESSALYSISLILDLAFTVCRDTSFGWHYLDTIAGIIKGVAPTLLIGRAAAGHTRPSEDIDGSTLSSLHFQTPSDQGMSSPRDEESTTQSSVLTMDIEAQPEQQVISIEQDDIHDKSS